MGRPPPPIPMLTGVAPSRPAAPEAAAGGYVVVDATFARTLATSHQRTFEVVAYETAAGPEAITCDVPNCIAEGLDERGLAVVGARVEAGDLLVGKATPRAGGPASPEEKLLRAIFGESVGDMRDTSLRMPAWLEGTVTGAELLAGGHGEIARARVQVSWERPLEIGDELDAGGRRVAVSEIRPAPHAVTIDGQPARGGVEVVRHARDVVEARAIGPYSMVSQQPVGGRESYGGQAITAAQRDALAAAGAGATLAELLAVKSDWVLGRTRCYESLIKSEDPEIRPRPPAPPASEPGGAKDIFSFFDRPASEREMTRSAAVLVAHARALGFDIACSPPPARVELLTAEAIRALSHGEVKKPETINHESHRPEAGGLFCQRIFGPVADYECACGKYRRLKYRGVVCEKCGVEVIGSRVRAERFGHIELEVPVPHPRIAGQVLEVVLVLPPDLRPLVPLDGGRFAISDLNDLYRRAINRNNRLARLRELDAPETTVAGEAAALAQAVAALVHNERLEEPVTGPDDRPLRSLGGLLPELGRAMLDKRVDYSGAGPLVIDPSLDARACRIPRVLARELFRPWVYGALERQGYVTTIKSAKRMVAADRAEAREALESESRGVPILLVCGDRLVARELGLWDHPAIAVAPGTAAALGGTFVQVHVPLSAAARAECAALPDCPEPRPAVPGGWLSAMLAGDDPIAVLCDAARTGEGDALEDPQLKAVFGL